jgi:hypothetical protein
MKHEHRRGSLVLRHWSFTCHLVIQAFARLARPERIELPTCWFEASRSIQLSYGRHLSNDQIPMTNDQTVTRLDHALVIGSLVIGHSISVG